MANKYFAGSSIPIVVAVTNGDGAVNPTAATIIVKDPHGTVLENGSLMSIATNQASFTLAASKTTEVGIYTFTCSIALPGGNTIVYRLTKLVE